MRQNFQTPFVIQLPDQTPPLGGGAFDQTVWSKLKSSDFNSMIRTETGRNLVFTTFDSGTGFIKSPTLYWELSGRSVSLSISLCLRPGEVEGGKEGRRVVAVKSKFLQQVLTGSTSGFNAFFSSQARTSLDNRLIDITSGLQQLIDYSHAGQTTTD